MLKPTLDLLMARAREQRYLTLDQIHQHIPQPDQSPELIEGIYARCHAESISVIDEHPPGSRPPEEDLEDSDIEHHLIEQGIESDDPVRMYLREIGRVSLLTYAEETLLAQQVERGDRAAERLRRGDYLLEDPATLQRVQAE